MTLAAVSYRFSGEKGLVPVSGWVVLTATVFAVLSPVLWIPLLRRAGAVDLPNARSSHLLPTIRGAGLAPASGVLLAALLVLTIDGQRPLLVLLAVALALAALGLVEDLHGLPVRARLAGQTFVGLLGGTGLCLVLGRPLWLAFLVALAFTGYVNVANFMDGIDGISAMHGAMAGLHYLIVGLAFNLPWLQLGAAVLSTVFLAFAPWNLHPRRRVFLGDVGSYLLGGLVMGCAVASWLATSQVLLAAAPLVIYLSDTSVTMFSRFRRGEPITQAHRTHVYQRLTDCGLNHLETAGVVTVASGACCAMAWWAWFAPAQGLVALTLGVVVLASYFLLPRLVVPSKA